MDHKNLQYYRSAQKVNQCITRYILMLGDYDISLVHKPRASNKVDALSWHLDYGDGTTDNVQVIALPSMLFAHALEVTDLKRACIQAQQQAAAQLDKWALMYPLNKQEDGSWWCSNEQLVIMADDNLRRGIMTIFHDSNTTGHPGILKTTALISREYWWPQMKQFITKYIQGCTVCQATKL